MNAAAAHALLAVVMTVLAVIGSCNPPEPQRPTPTTTATLTRAEKLNVLRTIAPTVLGPRTATNTPVPTATPRPPAVQPRAPRPPAYQPPYPPYYPPPPPPAAPRGGRLSCWRSGSYVICE